MLLPEPDFRFGRYCGGVWGVSFFCQNTLGINKSIEKNEKTQWVGGDTRWLIIKSAEQKLSFLSRLVRLLDFCCCSCSCCCCCGGGGGDGSFFSLPSSGV